MRIRIEIEMDHICLPYDYQRGIQAFLYSCLKGDYARNIHDGEQGEIKLFAFSNLYGKHEADQHGITFTDTAVLYVASPDHFFLEQVFQKIVKTEHIELYGNFLPVIRTEGIKNPGYQGSVQYRTLSPVSVYVTDTNGRTQYLSPVEDEELFAELIEENIRKKYAQVYGEEMDAYFNMYMIEHVKKRKCKYKGILYIAYEMTFKIDTSADVHDVIMDCGIGSRNAAGFGLVETVHKRK